MKKLWLCVGTLVCVIAVAAVAAEKSEDVNEQNEELEFLEKNIRLDFKTVPLEKGDDGISIITATPEFKISISLKGDDGQIQFEVSGEIILLDDDRIFVRYEAYTIISNKEGKAEFSVCSGVILKPGQELGVSRMGDKTFMIRASYVLPSASHGDSQDASK